jgi:TolB-like protein
VRRFSSFLAGLLMLGLAAPRERGARAADAPAARTPTVAVLYFDYEGKRDDLAVLKTGLAQMLISDLGTGESYRLVERARLQALLDEQKLGQTGKLDKVTAARVGKLLGAQLVVLGSFFDLGPTLRVDARLVDVETGKILHTVGATAKDDEFLDVERQIASDLGETLRHQPAVRPAGASEVSPAKHRPPPRPARLKTGTAVKYGRALAMADKGDRKGARAALQQVLVEQPDFGLARADLERLLQ